MRCRSKGNPEPSLRLPSDGSIPSFQVTVSCGVMFFGMLVGNEAQSVAEVLLERGYESITIDVQHHILATNMTNLLTIVSTSVAHIIYCKLPYCKMNIFNY